MLGMEYRYELPTWVIFDYMGIEEHLEKMAMKGWELDETGGLIWRYKKTTPKRKSYKAIFSKFNSDFNPSLNGPQIFLIEQLEEEGWKEIGEWRKVRIFESEEANADELDTDEMAKYNSIWSAMKGSYLVSWIMTFVAMTIITVKDILNIFREGINGFDKLWPTIFTSYAAIVAVIMILVYLLWSMKSKNNINRGGQCADTRYLTAMNRTILVGVLLLIIVYLSSKNGFGALTLINSIVCLGGAFLVVGAMIWVPRVLKSNNVSREKNITISVIVCIIIAFIGTVVLSKIL